MPFTPEQEVRLREIFREELSFMLKSDRFTFNKTIQVGDAIDFLLGRTIGARFGTAADQKIGFYGATPVIQASAITAPSGGATIDSQARTAIGSLITALHNLGLIA